MTFCRNRKTRRHSARHLFALAAVVAVLGTSTARAVEHPADDRFLAGYVAAVVEREFTLDDVTITARDGVVTLSGALPTGPERTKLAEIISRIDGVEEVRIKGEDPADDIIATAPKPKPAPTPEAAPATQAPAAEPVAVAEAKKRAILPERNLFDPLLADPRWAHFSAAYHYYVDDDRLTNVGAVSFGETFGLYGWESHQIPGRWELGFQAGVFAIFDLDAESKDLINADYWVGIPFVLPSGSLFRDCPGVPPEQSSGRRVSAAGTRGADQPFLRSH